jgi:TRAP-type C4-dicarboxylate transport system permease small subunit
MMNVILRYFFGFILSWAEEVILISFVWCIYLGVITAFRTDRHVAIDVIVNLFPRKVQRIIGCMVDILILVLSIYMTYLGIVLCMNVGRKTTTILRLSYVYVNLAVVISFGMVAIFSVVKIVGWFTGKYEYVDSATRTIKEVSEVSELQ